MKQTFFTLFLAFIAVTGSKAFAQPEVQNGANIEFNKEVHDYGTISSGSDGACTFELTNTGNQPLILSNAKGSCQCTVPEWPKEPIAPGAKATITVRYNTQNVGPINKTVTVTSNAVNEPTVVLRIKGNVTAPAEGTPQNNSGAPAVH